MAAGLGFKDFVTGEVLTAADVDGYLMQNIWVFADATARDAAVTSPQEGNFAYLKDTNTTIYYTGSAWTSIGGGGLTFIKSQTIGSAVSTVTVTGAFSSTYDNYLVQINLDTSSAASELYMTLGSQTTGYATSLIYMAPNSNTINGLSNSNNVSILTNYYSTDGGQSSVIILNPNKTKKTSVFAEGSGFATTASTFSWNKAHSASTTAFTAFTLAPGTGTITGGTIKVYGYALS